MSVQIMKSYRIVCNRCSHQTAKFASMARARNVAKLEGWRLHSSWGIADDLCFLCATKKYLTDSESVV